MLKPAKYIEIKKTHNGEIVELKFLLQPRRGWFAEHVTPAIAIIKAAIPASQRSFNPNTKQWEILIDSWPALSTIFEGMGWQILEVADKAAPVEVPQEYAENFYHNTSPVTTVESAESIAVSLSKYLGVEIKSQEVSELKKLYRQKAREFHPDINPEGAAQMSELNRLWTLYNSGCKTN